MRKNKKMIELEYCDEIFSSSAQSPESFVVFIETRDNIDDDLAMNVKVKMDNHIADCDSCRKKLDDRKY